MFGIGTLADFILPPRRRRQLAYIASMAGVFVCGVLARWGWEVMRDNAQDEDEQNSKD